MNEMVERLAKLMKAARICGTAEDPLEFPCQYCLRGPSSWDETGCVWLANAAIAALRVPTFAMCKSQTLLPPGQADLMWCQMIDAALAD